MKCSSLQFEFLTPVFISFDMTTSRWWHDDPYLEELTRPSFFRVEHKIRQKSKYIAWYRPYCYSVATRIIALGACTWRNDKKQKKLYIHTCIEEELMTILLLSGHCFSFHFRNLPTNPRMAKASSTDCFSRWRA